MGKIIHFPDNRPEFKNVTEFLEDTIKVMQEEDAVAILVAAKTSSGIVVTGYRKCDFCQRQELVGHIQYDIVDQMIRANPERYGGDA